MNRDPEIQHIADQLVAVAARLTDAKQSLFEALDALVAIKTAVAKLEKRLEGSAT